MKSTLQMSLALALSSLVLCSKSYSCDYCSLYTPMKAEELQSGSLSVGLSEDLFGYTKYRREGESAREGTNQNRKSDVTDITATVGLNRLVGLEVSVPLIEHRYKRLETGGYRGDTESGVGDLAVYTLINVVQTSNIVWQFYGGAKLPTGDTERLREETSSFPDNNVVPGHDLALGSGSVDIPLGTSISAQGATFLFEGTVGYVMRTEGDYNYQYADDLRWRTSLGVFFDSTPTMTFIPRVSLSGLHKDSDTLNGSDVTNSGLDVIEIGPSVELEMSHFSFSAGIDVPVSMDNSGLQAMQDHRVRFAVVGRL